MGGWTEFSIGEFDSDHVVVVYFMAV